MRAWASPSIPDAPTRELGPAPPLRLHDTRSGKVRTDRCPATRRGSTSAASRRTTPRTWATRPPTRRSTWPSGPGARPGHDVRYVQNVTDVDDPLLERARETGEDWVALAERETELFREDMAALVGDPARRLRGRRRVDPDHRRADRGAAGPRSGVRPRRRPLLRGLVRPALRGRLRLDAAADARGLRRAGR